MSFLDKLSKLGDLIVKPFELIIDYAREPIRGWEHGRAESAKASAHSHDKDIEQSRIKGESDARIREKESDANLAIKTRKLDRELEEWVKDQEVARFERVTEAVMRYRQEFATLNQNAINAIGIMQIELRRRAHDLVEEKTWRYKVLQQEAFDNAVTDLTRIEQQFPDNPVARKMLEDAVQTKLITIIDGAGRFIVELNVDLKLLSESVTRLSERGEEFVTVHLQQFHTRQLGHIDQLATSPAKLIDKS